MERQPITLATVNRQDIPYRCSEDGFTYYHTEWIVVAYDDKGRQWVRDYSFPSETKAAQFADRVFAAKSINPDLWIDCTPEKGLPDYVLNPYRPEYN